MKYNLVVAILLLITLSGLNCLNKKSQYSKSRYHSKHHSR